MNQKLLIASTLVIAATFAISFAAVMDNQANAQTRVGNIVGDATNTARQTFSGDQLGLVNAGNVNVQANVVAQDVIDVLSGNRVIVNN